MLLTQLTILRQLILGRLILEQLILRQLILGRLMIITGHLIQGWFILGLLIRGWLIISYFTKAQKISLRKHNRWMLNIFKVLLVSQKPLYVGMCLQCVGCRWVGLKAKTKTVPNQSKNLTKFSEIKKIRKKKYSTGEFFIFKKLYFGSWS